VATITDTDLDVLTAFIVKGQLGSVSIPELHCGYVEFCAGHGVRALDSDTFTALLERLTVKLAQYLEV